MYSLAAVFVTILSIYAYRIFKENSERKEKDKEKISIKNWLIFGIFLIVLLLLLYLYYFRKNGDTETLYAGEQICEGGYTTGYYNLYLIEFDEIFDLYLVKKMEGYERVKPTELGYVEADTNDEIFDLMHQSNLALWPASRRMLNVAYTEDGTKCVFDEYIDKSNSDMYRTITQSYPLVEHPEYGKVALTYTYFRGGQPNIKEKTLIDSIVKINRKDLISKVRSESVNYRDKDNILSQDIEVIKKKVLNKD